ncbi:farnesyl pyrophosphate synthase isoform X1 [Lepeophtheirus salmonis]|uniref:farnesyl pyrophosphate synthase isoform X1 n=1 Tax=Lepeophtheirus salmonis TaxID=72036 RepID=UPI003AF34B2F
MYNIKPPSLQMALLLRNLFFRRSLCSTAINVPNVLFTKEDSRIFMAEFPNLVRELTFDDSISRHLPLDVSKHLSKCIQYNVPHGKKTRGLAVLATYKHLVSETKISNVSLKEAIVMGWCVEFLQAYFLIADDIMDGSTTRRQHECWYKKNNIGLNAINDALLLETCVYQLLRNHFKSKPYYQDCVDLFLEVNRMTTFGQSLDIMTSNKDSKPNLELYDMNRYISLVKYKTSFYSTYLPVALGMKMCGVYDNELYRQARTILLEMGHYFQVQDDYIDCFGDPKQTGKIGTDIQDAKCSWLVVVALQRANRQQKEILKSCYGSTDEENVAKVKSVYKELKIPKIYATYEENTYKAIETNINQLSGGDQGIKLPPQLFKAFLNSIYRRHN